MECRDRLKEMFGWESVDHWLLDHQGQLYLILDVVYGLLQNMSKFYKILHVLLTQGVS